MIETIEQVLRDVRYGSRGLWRDRPATVTTVSTIGVVLSLVTVVFTIFNAYVLRPFGVRDPGSLHEISWISTDAEGRRFAWRDFQAIGERRDLFTDVIAEGTRVVSSDGRRMNAAFVSANYFDALGARVRLGRALAGFDAAGGGSAVAVLSDEGWVRLFDRDPGAIGRSIDVNGEQVTVVGVMAPAFSGLDDSPRDLWLPIAMYPAVVKVDLFGTEQPPSLGLTARLRPEITAPQAADALGSVIAQAFPEREGVRAHVLPQSTPVRFSLDLVAMLSPVFAAFLLVVFTACANVSSILLARATARHREIGVRLALGASRARIVRHLLTEGALIAGAAGLLALGLANLLLELGTKVLFLSLPPLAASMIRVVPLDFDVRVFAFTFAAAAGTAVMFALVPALQATRLTLTHALRGEAGPGLRGSRLRSFLVAGQVAICLVLLIAAATLMRNSLAVASMDLGLRTNGIISVNQRAAGEPMIARAAAALEAAPGTAEVVATSRNPLFGQSERFPASSPATRQVIGTSVLSVSPGYFSMMDIEILHGRSFTAAEAQSEGDVGVLSAAAARAFFPNGGALGATIRVAFPDRNVAADRPDRVDRQPGTESGTSITIVGIVRDVVSGLVYEGPDRSLLYLPTHARGARAQALLVRGRSAQDVGSHALETILRRVHPDPLAFEAVSLDEILAMQLYPLRVASWIGALLCGIALGLGVSGIFGVVTYALTQRTKEIGIRMALGASTAAVVRLLLTQSGRLVAIGVAAGGVGAFAALAFLASFVRLDGVVLLDPGAFAAGVLVIGAAAALATYYPARRAVLIDPAVTLRADG